MNNIEVIDYGGGNLGSVLRCLNRLAVPYKIISGNGDLPSGNASILLPGVGSFGAVMKSLGERGLIDPIVSLVKSGTPYLGICLGLQILFESSEESLGVKGFALLEGDVRKYRTDKVPQIGWNLIRQPVYRQDSGQNLGDNAGFPASGYVYFVNSYYAVPSDPNIILYEADYDGAFCAAVRHEHITAFQFHPEKSGAFGHALLHHSLTSYAREAA